MIKVQQIVKPFNSGFSAVSIKYLLEDLQRRYVANIADNVVFKAVKEKNTYYVLCRIPSESNYKYKSNPIYYDVILELNPPNKAALEDENLRDYDVKVFSNCPSFVYSFTFVYFKKKALVNMPKGFYTRKALSVAPKTRNPLLLFGIEKTLWFTVCHMDANKYWKRSVLESMITEKETLKDIIKELKVVGQDQKLSEVELRMRQFSNIVKNDKKKEEKRKRDERPTRKLGRTSEKKEDIDTLRSKLSADLSTGLNKTKTSKSSLGSSSLKSNLNTKKKPK